MGCWFILSPARALLTVWLVNELQSSEFNPSVTLGSGHVLSGGLRLVAEDLEHVLQGRKNFGA